jgi:hypothetical protein
MSRRLCLPLALLLLAAGPVPQDPGETVIVTRKTTKLRSAKRVFAQPVAELVEGDKLVCEQREGAWLQAKHGDLTGWLHATDVSARADVRLSGEGVRETYSAAEAGAARKGFNPQVERSYKQQNPDLAAAFALVDRIQAARASEAEVQAFAEQGGLRVEGGR